MPDPADLVALARRYVEASNAHDLAAVGALLADDVSYSSSGVGEHGGRTAVLAMMTGFFARFPDVHWRCAGLRACGRYAAEFEFVLSATAAADGQAIERHGNERVFCDAAGLVRRIEVRDTI